MAWKNETLHKGLYTAMDPAMAPEGSLQKAENARYRPNDPAIWQAEGRATIADGTHGVSLPVPAVAGIQWDPGSGSELAQILYVNTDTQQLATIQALPTASDPGMNAANRTLYTNPTGVNPSLDSGTLVPIQFENEHFILTGGDNLKMARSGGTTTLYRHGMPATPFVNTDGIDDPSPVGTIQMASYVSGATGMTLAQGFYFFWVTWYDSTNDIEGGAESNGATFWLQSADVNTVTLKLNLDKTTFDDNKPATADKIRIYCSGAYEAENINSVPVPGFATPLTNAWPNGYLIGELAVTDDANNDFGYYTIFIGGSGSGLARIDIQLTTTQLENLGLFYLSYADNTVSAAGAQANKFGEPPSATTGDVFEESLILNDINDPRKMRFSFPGNPEAFPSVFYVNFETDDWDQVVAIRTLGNKLGVFMANAVWRVNWLPSTSDLDFGRGRVKDLVVAGRGSFSHKTVTRFSMNGQPLLAYVSRSGIYATDLYQEIKLTQAVDWVKLLEGRDPQSGILLDDPDNERLIFMLNNIMFYLHYDRMHLEEGTPAITGPVQRPNGIKAAALVRLTNGNQQIVNTATSSVKMFYEGQGFTDAGNPAFTLVWGVKTRDIYPWGPGREGHITQYQSHVKPSTGGMGSWNTKVNGFLSGTQSPVVKISPTITASIRQLKSSTGRALIEFYNVEIVGSSTQASMAVNFVGVEGEDLDQADAR